MPEFVNGMRLYHGSYCTVEKPDLNKCAKYKDFGQGFYLTTSKEQAQNFIRISLKKAISQNLVSTDCNFGYVTVFTLNLKESLNYYEFTDTDASWLHCVVGHRKCGSFDSVVKKMSVYDVISGKIANDQTNATIATYMDGIFGPMGTDNADRVCISLLLPERLQNQFCFRTQKSINCLSFKESEKICL